MLNVQVGCEVLLLGHSIDDGVGRILGESGSRSIGTQMSPHRFRIFPNQWKGLPAFICGIGWTLVSAMKLWKR